MANIWVQAINPRRPDTLILVRTDTITQLSVNDVRIFASRVESNDAVLLVHRDTEGGKPLPEDFHMSYLVTMAKAREQARDSVDDLILLADRDDNGNWDWSIFTASELLA
ncbi:hypothetical protein QIS99_28200 [Streptomyces sp. B-S-A8]|uniref:Uncharacterized protein n=1 Tax=Streptomyces solicavernae TaxID=3043614 RepID=A0ABT6S035_9ACTN|nr:hypothetical protein [Streptomyces sp. B-S-A8]MDI3390044.1 hypothetical protein [Streptomyces sp. B-S-A8]